MPRKKQLPSPSKKDKREEMISLIEGLYLESLRDVSESYRLFRTKTPGGTLLLLQAIPDWIFWESLYRALGYEPISLDTFEAIENGEWNGECYLGQPRRSLCHYARLFRKELTEEVRLDLSARKLSKEK